MDIGYSRYYYWSPSFSDGYDKINPELSLTFLGGWTKYALENPSLKDDSLKANLAGFQSIMKVYLANMYSKSGFKKDKKIEKLIKMSPEKLEKWIKRNI